MTKMLNIAEVIEMAIKNGIEARRKEYIEDNSYPLLWSIKQLDEQTLEVELENNEKYLLKIQKLNL